MKKIIVLMSVFATLTAYAAENCTATKKVAVCTEKSVKAVVDEACKIIETKGQAGLKLVKKLSFDCCGEPNYVWINDMTPKMVMHPIKSQLDGKDLNDFEDIDHKKIYVEFVKALKKDPQGAWVEYKWPKMGEPDPTPKAGWVKACTAKGEKEAWVVGSGTWK